MSGVVAEQKLLELIGDTAQLLDLQQFHHRLLDALRRAVPSDWVAINDIGPGPEIVLEIIDPPIAPEALAVFYRYAEQSPLMERYRQTGDGRVVRISDVITQADFHRREVYTEFYAPLGLEYQMAFTLPHERDRLLAVILSRRAENFTDGERDLVERARPFLIQAYLNSLRFSDLLLRLDAAGAFSIGSLRALGLTRRQTEVLALAATGADEHDIATRLGISHRTVQKHLQLCYRALGVSTRSQAAAVAWSTSRGEISAP